MKKTLQGNANCSAPKTVIGVTTVKYFVRTDNPRYFGGKQNINFSQNLPNMGGENCTVLGLRLMNRLEMSLILLLKNVNNMHKSNLFGRCPTN